MFRAVASAYIDEKKSVTYIRMYVSVCFFRILCCYFELLSKIFINIQLSDYADAIYILLPPWKRAWTLEMYG